MNLTITVIAGCDKGKIKSFKIFPIVIGRLPDNDFQLNDSFVSRRHCTIYTDGFYFTVSDLKSTNNTLLNMRIINSPKTFINGDELNIGQSVLKLNVD